jgi:hypothetical protein
MLGFEGSWRLGGQLGVAEVIIIVSGVLVHQLAATFQLRSVGALDQTQLTATLHLWLNRAETRVERALLL